MDELSTSLARQKDGGSYGIIFTVFCIVSLLWLLASVASAVAILFALANGVVGGLILLYVTSPIIFTPFLVVRSFFMWRSHILTESKGRFIDPDCFLGEEEQKLYQLVHDLAVKLGLPRVPVVAVMPEQTNAFAIGTGRADSGICLGSPLLQQMSWNEIEAVVAHELGHINNRDVVATHMMITVVEAIDSVLLRPMMKLSFLGQIFGGGMAVGGLFSRNGGLFALFGVMLQLVFLLLLIPLLLFRWLVGLVFGLVQAVHSRRREFRADAVAALLTSPEAMVAALARLERIIVPFKRSDDPMACAKIMFNALPERSAMQLWGLFPDWFASHPRTVERIKALQARTYVDG